MPNRLFYTVKLHSEKIISNKLNINMTFEELYRRADVNDSKVYDMICAKNVNGVFQIESNMFKGLLDLIQPRNINDIAALVALG